MTDPQIPPKHVLVVDDTEEILHLFRDIIEGMGHRITAWSYSPDDLAEVVRVKPDLVIADVTIGQEKLGWQLVQKMRMSPTTEMIPIVICTAATLDVREQEAWLTAQAIKVVLKPFTLSNLEAAVTEALELPKTAALERREPEVVR